MQVSKSGVIKFSILIGLILISGIILLAFPFVFSATEYGPAPMNATINQTIAILLSGNLSTGIFFTNTTGLPNVAVQYPITNMGVFNNATGNYLGDSSGSTFNVSVPSSNTAPVKVCHCVCQNLTCSPDTPACGTETLRVYESNQGVHWYNSTGPTTFAQSSPPTSTYALPAPGTLIYQVVNGSMPQQTSASIYLRYWLNPYPETVTSGVYNTTYKFKGVEASLNCGTADACTC